MIKLAQLQDDSQAIISLDNIELVRHKKETLNYKIYFKIIINFISGRQEVFTYSPHKEDDFIEDLKYLQSLVIPR